MIREFTFLTWQLWRSSSKTSREKSAKFILIHILTISNFSEKIKILDAVYIVG
jgi:hypothetical protein